MRPILIALIAVFGLSLGAAAQNSTSPAILVNNDAITYFELDQREKLLRVFNTPGDLRELAQEQLIEERLKMQATRRAGMQLTPESLKREMEAFAGRANLSYAQFLQVLSQNGIAEQSLRDFVSVGVTWRDYVRRRFGERAEINDTDVDRALGRQANAATNVEVLMNEIILAAPPKNAAAAQARARQIAQITSYGAFEAAARKYSALPSRGRGGRMNWVPITNFPPAIRPILLGLTPGKVTEPIPIPNGIALFQMRQFREVKRAIPAPASIDYLTFAVPGGLSEAGRAQAAKIKARVDTCDDFYGVAKGLPREQLQRQSVAPGQIPTDVAIELAKLDSNEVSANLTRNGGSTLLMVMLCSRTAKAAEGIDRDAVRTQLLSRRLGGYANAHLEDLRASAKIRLP